MSLLVWLGAALARMENLCCFALFYNDHVGQSSSLCVNAAERWGSMDTLSVTALAADWLRDVLGACIATFTGGPSPDIVISVSLSVLAWSVFFCAHPDSSIV